MVFGNNLCKVNWPNRETEKTEKTSGFLERPIIRESSRKINSISYHERKFHRKSQDITICFGSGVLNFVR